MPSDSPRKKRSKKGAMGSGFEKHATPPPTMRGCLSNLWSDKQGIPLERRIFKMFGKSFSKDNEKAMTLRAPRALPDSIDIGPLDPG